MAPGSGPNSASGGSAAKYSAGDLVLAKVRGYPPWPGIIVDDENVPKAVLKERRSRDHYVVRFFPAADYHFATARDLSQLTTKQIEAYVKDPSKKGGELKDAYKCAGNDPQTWNEEQNEIVRNHENAKLLAEEEEQENEDQLEEEADDDDEVAPKKRKRDDDGVGKMRESATDKRKKQKVKADASKLAAKPTSSTKKASNGDHEADEDSDPEVKKVKDWRHKLQRAFLTAKDGLQADDMPANDETFKLVEAYDDMTMEQYKLSKIGKVMKKIIQLEDIPRDDEFHFRERAQKLVDKWQAMLVKQGDGEAKDVPGQDAPAQDDAPAEDKPETDTAAEPAKEEAEVKPSTDA